MIEGILIGIKTALSFQNLLMVMIGCFAGTIIGMLPGLGPMTAIALMIPITYGFDPATGLILMAGVYYGAVFGGSTSSILINAPGVTNRIILLVKLDTATGTLFTKSIKYPVDLFVSNVSNFQEKPNAFTLVFLGKFL